MADTTKNAELVKNRIKELNNHFSKALAKYASECDTEGYDIPEDELEEEIAEEFDTLIFEAQNLFSGKDNISNLPNVIYYYSLMHALKTTESILKTVGKEECTEKEEKALKTDLKNNSEMLNSLKNLINTEIAASTQALKYVEEMQAICDEITL